MTRPRIEAALTQEALVHRRPWLMPAAMVVAVVGALASLVLAGRQITVVREATLAAFEHAEAMRWAGIVVLSATAVLAVLEQVRRFDRDRPPLAVFLRVNRAAAYGVAVTLGGLLLLVAGRPELGERLLESIETQGLVLGSMVGGSVVAYALVVHPVVGRRAEALAPFPVQVEEQQDSYDYTLGVRYPEDWENASHGPREWAVWPHLGTYGNLLCVGQIGSGKTSQIADPLVQQALRKFPSEPVKRVSLVVMDLKGNQSARYWEWAKTMGRAEDFWVLRPDVLEDTATGQRIIPQDRYVSFNALGGWEETDLLAIEFQEALESTKDRPSPDYFRTVQQEFLIHALRLLRAEMGDDPDLADVQAFGASGELRAAMVEGSQREGTGGLALVDSRNYFKNEFGRLSPQDQAGLLRGLASQLTLLTNRAVRSAFCPKRDDNDRRELDGWHAEVLERPGIIVFSCPPAKFTDGLSRLLGVLVLKSFQQAMLARCDASFQGNRERPVMLMIDEAHAFMNKRLGDFMSVSREARVCSVLLTQSLTQIPEHYRGTVLSNTRTRVVLSVSDETAERFSSVLGEVEEVRETVSVSESLHGASDHALREKKTGRSKGIAASRSFSAQQRRRWSAHAIQHLPRFRAVAHVFDGEEQRPSEMIETAPWYRLPYYLLNPLRHPNVKCGAGGTHLYGRDKTARICSKCGKRLSEAWEISDLDSCQNVIARLGGSR